jgi:hypothetical protein
MQQLLSSLLQLQQQSSFSRYLHQHNTAAQPTTCSTAVFVMLHGMLWWVTSDPAAAQTAAQITNNA